MTDLERVLEYARAYAPLQYPVFKDAITRHQEEDAELRRKYARLKDDMAKGIYIRVKP